MSWAQALGAAADLGGAFVAAESARRRQHEEATMQKEFAQNGILWRVQDAERAGVHPLYALGANTASYSPVVTAGDTALGEGISRMGQNLMRSATPSQTDEERRQESMRLEAARASAVKDYAIADYYTSEAERTRQAGRSSAPFPKMKGGDPSGGIPGQVSSQPDKVISKDVDDPTLAAGKHGAYKRVQIGTSKKGTPLWFYVPNTDDQDDMFSMNNVIGSFIKGSGLADWGADLKDIHLYPKKNMTREGD